MEAVFITGASKGIGLDAARHLIERGYRVFGTVRKEEDAGRLEALGVEPVSMDVTDAEAVERAARRVTEALDGRRLRALVNNAGIPAAGPIELTDLDAARRLFEVNFFGVLAVTRAFLPLLRGGGGRVVNISSVAGRFTFPFAGLYSASKHALEAMSDALRRELLLADVQVVLVEPGSVQTPIWEHIESIDLNRFRGTPYERVMPMVRDSAVRGGREGLPVERVSEAVHRAVAETRPPVRIPVVASRPRWLLQRALPARLWDRLIARMLTRAASGEMVKRPLR